MSIERRTHYSWFCICDNCDAELSGGNSFLDAVAAKKQSGWKSKKDSSGDWIDICPECQKAIKEDDSHGKNCKKR